MLSLLVSKRTSPQRTLPQRMPLEKLGAYGTFIGNTSHDTELRDRAMQQGKEGVLNGANKPRKNGTKTEEIQKQ